jgi:hypothetical protein
LPRSTMIKALIVIAKTQSEQIRNYGCVPNLAVL